MAKRTPAPIVPSPSLQARQAVKPPVKRNLPAKTTNHMSNKQAGSKPAASNLANAKLDRRPLGLDGKELEIRIDLEKLTFGDIEMAMDFEDGKTPMKEILPFLNRVVIGGVKHIPLTAMPAIMDALTEALEGIGNPKN